MPCMNKYIKQRSTQSSVPQKDSNLEVHSHSHHALITEDLGALNQDLSTSQVIRSLFEGTLKPSNAGLKIVKIDGLQDANFKECLLSICRNESESVPTVCNPEDIREGVSGLTNDAQIITNSEGLSC